MKPYPREQRNEVVEISRWALNDPVIEGVEFTNCTIVGPAVVVPLEGCHIVHSSWDAPGWEDLVWVIPPSRQSVVGAVGLRNCTFSNCTFRNVGLAVREDQVDELRTNFGI